MHYAIEQTQKLHKQEFSSRKTTLFYWLTLKPFLQNLVAETKCGYFRNCIYGNQTL